MQGRTEALADARDMLAAHMMFRREFGLMPGLVREVTIGDMARAAVIADHVVFVSSVLNRHHAGEDSYMWPPLQARCPEDCAQLVAAMKEQHAGIHRLLVQIAAAQEIWRGIPTEENREALAAALDRLLPLMTEHLGLEEARVVPLIERYVPSVSYARAGQDQGSQTPTELLPTLFGMFMYEAEPAAIALARSHMPPDVQPVIASLGAAAYAAYAARLYGTATPRRAKGTS